MTKTEETTKYEMALILDAHLDQAAKDEVVKSVCDTIVKSGGKVINNQVWLDKQKFTFEIKKKTEGTYYLINFEGEGSCADAITKTLRLNEKVLRFGIYKAE